MNIYGHILYIIIQYIFTYIFLYKKLLRLGLLLIYSRLSLYRCVVSQFALA